MKFTFGSLFSGIGGLDLGLERAGMTCKYQSEIDDYASAILANHWPAVRNLGDVRNLGAHNLPTVDLICGGFPCQGLSVAGKRRGFGDSRSGLWEEMLRIVREVRPRYVLVENSGGSRSRVLERILWDLAASGYDASWDVLPASAFGAFHTRERLFLVAWDASNPYSKAVRFESKRNQWEGWSVGTPVSGDAEPLDNGPIDGWEARPPLARVDDGIAHALDRYRCTGNAVAPPVAEHVGRQIVRDACGGWL